MATAPSLIAAEPLRVPALRAWVADGRLLGSITISERCRAVLENRLAFFDIYIGLCCKIPRTNSSNN
jgi:hypothetical protein